MAQHQPVLVEPLTLTNRLATSQPWKALLSESINDGCPGIPRKCDPDQTCEGSCQYLSILTMPPELEAPVIRNRRLRKRSGPILNFPEATVIVSAQLQFSLVRGLRQR